MAPGGIRKLKKSTRRPVPKADFSTLLLDAGGTIVFPNVERISAELAKDGIYLSPAKLAEAERQVRFELDSPDIVRATSDAGRWARYLQRLFHFMGTTDIPISALYRIKQYHDAHNLWDFVPPDVPPALDALGRRFRLGVVSNSNGTVRALLQRLGLAGRFETIVDSQEEGVEKPDPKIFQIALGRMKIEAGATAYVGDLYHIDVVGARAAGLTAYLLDPHGLHRDKKVVRLKSLSELAV